MSFGLPFTMDANERQNALACLYVLVPVALLCSLFCARLGIERGRALAGGILPGLLFFGVSLFAAYHFTGGSILEITKADGWLLLAAFAVLRADPPVPVRAGYGWTLAAALLGALSAAGNTDTLVGVLGLVLYVGWSAGFQRALEFGLTGTFALAMIRLQAFGWHDVYVKGIFVVGNVTSLALAWFGFFLREWRPPIVAPAAGPETPGRVPMSSAHRIVGVLIYLAFMGVPAAIRHEPGIGQWANVLLPLDLAGGLILTRALDLWLRPAASN